jgi:hypothetical protein
MYFLIPNAFLDIQALIFGGNSLACVHYIKKPDFHRGFDETKRFRRVAQLAEA